MDFPPPEQQTSSPIMNDVLMAFAEKLKTFATPEEKIAYGLAFMRQSISQEGSPHFREFWEARRLVLPCFRENINIAIRSKLWGEYVELTTEARRLKDILEEQSSFAAEQIDLAIQALEKEISHFEGILAEIQEIYFPEASPTVRERREFYNQVQRELNLLNTLASRLTGLRKEIIKTDMRIRFKTRFLKRLSSLGDHVFPKRKELIDQVSREFEQDVEKFVVRHFKESEVIGAPYFAVREEIKALQAMAKILTLSSGVFSRTRLRLSECWDKVRHLEKEYKRKQTEKLRDLAPLPIEEQKLRELEAIEREKLRIKREKGTALKEQIIQLQKEAGEIDLELLTTRYETLFCECEEWGGSKQEKQPLQRLLRNVHDLLVERQENTLLNLSEDDRKTLENLRLVLEQKRERRLEIKEQIEACRKALGASSLDFEKAIYYRELMDQEKERLEKANAGIEEIELKIQELEG